MSEQKTHAETIADIIAEMRNDANADEYTPDGILGQTLNCLADRLEAAHKRERGNCAKLRDALVQVQKKINYLIGNLTVPNSLVANRMEINGIINAALAAPPRNCDVGTAEEQAKRFSRSCQADVLDVCSKSCQFYNHSRSRDDCAIQWEQTPYTEGGTE